MKSGVSVGLKRPARTSLGNCDRHAATTATTRDPKRPTPAGNDIRISFNLGGLYGMLDTYVLSGHPTPLHSSAHSHIPRPS